MHARKMCNLIIKQIVEWLNYHLIFAFDNFIPCLKSLASLENFAADMCIINTRAFTVFIIYFHFKHLLKRIFVLI